MVHVASIGKVVVEPLEPAFCNLLSYNKVKQIFGPLQSEALGPKP